MLKANNGNLVVFFALLLLAWSSLSPGPPDAASNIKRAGATPSITPLATSTLVTYLPLVSRNHFSFLYRPVTGSIGFARLEGCCYCCGQTIDGELLLEAESPFAPVTEMRLALVSSLSMYQFPHCLLDEERMEQWTDWEPFTPRKEFSFVPSFRWEPAVTLSPHVQYRDALGNLSPIYCIRAVVLHGTPTATSTNAPTPTPTVTPTGTPPTPTPFIPITPLPTSSAPAYVPLIPRNFDTPPTPTPPPDSRAPEGPTSEG